MESYEVLVERYKPFDPRLGRHIRHDSRSLFYQIKAQDVSQLVSIRHNVHIPILDQGQLASCTGNAATACVASDPFWATISSLGYLSESDSVSNEGFSVGVYSEATSLDPFSGSYPPDDTGSDGLSVAQVLQKRGLISGYQHATSLEAALTALAKQPVIVGTIWRADMFNPEGDGRIRITGEDQGGHEYLLDELDVENKRVWVRNSWSASWGLDGRGYLTWDDFSALLSDSGDVTVFVPISSPAPEPEKPEPSFEDEIWKLVHSIKRRLQKIEDKLSGK